MKVFTFWEGPMPDYIKLCLKTWKFDYTMLNFNNLSEYTTIDIPRLKTFPLPQVSDAVRAHVLRDNGGYWLDADTIINTGKLPKENIIGNPETRTHSTGVCHYTEDAKDFFEKWAEYQDKTIANSNHSTHWSVLVNMFTDDYVKDHNEVTIVNIENYRPELKMIQRGESREKYINFYFGSSFHLKNIPPTDMFVLHNSWTPKWYTYINDAQVLNSYCTLSNILREILK